MEIVNMAVVSVRPAEDHDERAERPGSDHRAGASRCSG
jgi:hypothetical protein